MDGLPNRSSFTTFCITFSSRWIIASISRLFLASLSSRAPKHILVDCALSCDGKDYIGRRCDDSGRWMVKSDFGWSSRLGSATENGLGFGRGACRKLRGFGLCLSATETSEQRMQCTDSEAVPRQKRSVGGKVNVWAVGLGKIDPIDASEFGGVRRREGIRRFGGSCTTTLRLDWW